MLVAIQDEAQRKMIGSAYTALRKIGARNPLNVGYRGSFAFIGYTGPGRPSFVQQVMESNYSNMLRVSCSSKASSLIMSHAVQICSCLHTVKQSIAKEMNDDNDLKLA